ncbi:MAG: hypothetical protein M1305_06270 [Candidatus Marsarchaeota archaeon]|nr:hypothetical protein [Candidatus Marsarchaeota archaeon]
MKPLAQYPCIERDWTVTVPESLSYQELLDTITRFRPVSVEAIQLISIFRHERIGAGKKNVSFAIHIQRSYSNARAGRGRRSFCKARPQC